MCEDIINQSTIRKLYRLVKSYVLQHSGTMHDVDDVIQEGLYKFLQVYAKNGFKMESNPENYIFTICKNFWLKELKKRQKIRLSSNQNNEEVEDSAYLQEQKMRDEALIRIVERNKKLLSNKCQQLFDFRKDGLSCIEVAALLGLKNSQMVRDKQYRCMERLREFIKKDRAYQDLINDD